MITTTTKEEGLPRKHWGGTPSLSLLQLLLQVLSHPTLGGKPTLACQDVNTCLVKAAKVARKMKKLDTSYNSTPQHSLIKNKPRVKEATTGKIAVAPPENSPMVQIHSVYNASLASDTSLPRTYKEAMAGKDSEKWAAAVKKEIDNFNKQKVWMQVARDTMGRNQKALHTRWIFCIKTDTDGNQVYKARLVVKGYEQVPGVDFTETFSPVAGDTTICTVLATAMHLGWVCEAIDVEAAFLNANLKEDVIIEVPEGFGTGGRGVGMVCMLLKAVYGIVQAPRCWTKTFSGYQGFEAK